MTNAATKFETMLADLKAILASHFRGLDADAKEEAVAEAVAAAWENFLHLVADGREEEISVHTLAYYAAKAVRSGRHVGSESAANDVLHASVARRAEFGVVSLGEEITASRKVTPADEAAFRIDFRTWTRRLTVRQQEIARRLLAGYTTSQVARLMGVTAAAISLTRRKLERSWNEFQGIGA